MRRKMQNKTPWLNPDGTPKSEEEITRSCKSWSPSDWEDYLKSTEINQEEVLLDDPVLIEEYSQEASDAFHKSILDARELPDQRYFSMPSKKSLLNKKWTKFVTPSKGSLELQKGGALSHGKILCFKEFKIKYS